MKTLKLCLKFLSERSAGSWLFDGREETDIYCTLADEYQLNAAVRAVALDARHTLAS